MTGNPEERTSDIAALIGALPPVPAGLVEAAKLLPKARHDVDTGATFGQLIARQRPDSRAVQPDGSVSRPR